MSPPLRSLPWWLNLQSSPITLDPRFLLLHCPQSTPPLVVTLPPQTVSSLRWGLCLSFSFVDSSVSKWSLASALSEFTNGVCRPGIWTSVALTVWDRGGEAWAGGGGLGKSSSDIPCSRGGEGRWEPRTLLGTRIIYRTHHRKPKEELKVVRGLLNPGLGREPCPVWVGQASPFPVERLSISSTTEKSSGIQARYLGLRRLPATELRTPVVAEQTWRINWGLGEGIGGMLPTESSSRLLKVFVYICVCVYACIHTHTHIFFGFGFCFDATPWGSCPGIQSACFLSLSMMLLILFVWGGRTMGVGLETASRSDLLHKL